MSVFNYKFRLALATAFLTMGATPWAAAFAHPWHSLPRSFRWLNGMAPTSKWKSGDTRRLQLPHVVQVDGSMNNGDYVNPSICAVACFAATATFTTVPYFSLDESRSITIAYNGDQAFPRPSLYVDLNGDDGSGVSINSFTVSATLNGSPVTFLTGSTLLTFEGAMGWVRLAGQFDATSLATNNYPVVITAKVFYADGTNVEKTVNASVIIVNETNSPIAKGWTVAGVQHLYATIGGGFLVTAGDGSGTAFSAVLDRKATDYSRLTFDNASSTYTRTYSDGRRIIFNSVGQETSAIELNGRTYTFSYDAQGRLQDVRDPYRKQPNGSATSIGLAYDLNGLHQIQEPGADGSQWSGRNTWFTVDANRCLRSAQDPDGVQTQYTCDSNGRLSTITDRRGAVTTIGYGSTWKLSTLTLPQIAVDAGGGATTLTNPVIHFSPWQGTYSSYLGSVIPSVQDPLGRRTRFTVNTYGQALNVTDPAGIQTTTTTVGIRPLSITHPVTGTTTFSYDTLGRVTKAQVAGRDSVKYSYVGFLLQKVIGPGLDTTTYHYNAANEPDTITNSGSPTQRTIITYNASTLRPATVSDNMKHKTTYAYDAMFGNLDTTIAPGNRLSKKVFDHYGRDSIVTPPVGAAQVTTYDILNRVLSTTANSTTITLAYDQLFQTDLYDADNNHYHTDYNALGWPTSQCDAFAKCSTTRYDASGAVMSTTNRRNQIVSVTRDTAGRVTSRSGAGLVTSNYSYPANGHDLVAWDSVEIDSLVNNPGTYTTPERDSVVTWIGGYRYRIYHRYPGVVADVDSVTITSSTGSTFDARVATYSASGFLSSFKIGANTIPFAPNADGTGGVFTYPAFTRTSAAASIHLTDSVSFNNGLSANFLRKYHYDLDGRIDQMVAENPLKQTIFGYDPLGRLTAREYRSGCTFVATDSTSGPTYSCPTLLSSQYFTYDAMGNRTDNGGVPTTGNRYASFNGATYTYDADGNVARKYKAGVYDIYFYWNALNQLDSVVNNGYRTYFEYNALGHPVRVKEAASGPLTLQRYLLWDGENLLSQLGPAGQRGVDYAYLPGATDHPFAYEHGATTPTDISYYEIDELGNVIGTSQSGSLRQDDSYDGWGVHASNLPTDQWVYWKGLFWNGDNTGLYYMRNRWYDPEAGRFVNEDPAGFAGGANLYAFAGNDPVNGLDASGLSVNCVLTVLTTYVIATGQVISRDIINETCTQGGGEAGGAGGAGNRGNTSPKSKPLSRPTLAYLKACGLPWANAAFTAAGDVSFLFGGKEAFIAGKLAWGERGLASMLAKDATRGAVHAALEGGYWLASVGALSTATADRFGVGMTKFGESYILEQPDNAAQLAMQDKFRWSDFIPIAASIVAVNDARACSQ